MLGGGHQPIIKADRKRKMRDQYTTEETSSRHPQQQQEEPALGSHQHANNEQDLLTDDSQAEAGGRPPQVIPLNRIKFTAPPGLAPAEPPNDLDQNPARSDAVTAGR